MADTFNAKKLLRKVWARADADGSGELDADELKLVLQAMGQKNPDMEEVMKEVDTDGSGEVDKEEFERWFFAQDQNSMEILGALSAADEAFDKAISAHKESMADESYDKSATPATRKKASRESKAQFQAAIDAYTQAIELGAPEQDEVLGSRAECYASIGQMQKALEDATAAVELNDESDSWLILQGQIYYAMGKSKEAKNSFLEARDINKEIQPQDDGVLRQKQTIDAMLEMIADHPWEPPAFD